jgi:hypothetical protein
MTQSKLESLMEAVVSTLVGLAVAFTAQATIAWAYDMPLSARDNFLLVFWMTVISVLRQYVIRRIWNRRLQRKLARGD